mmetsp:Transcript_15383/g.26716  ORF Transcript_15383/g.26716 Transcript_15383/m.26716 type:complete len:157 (+) Transcript_15383:807-1277(+)
MPAIQQTKTAATRAAALLKNGKGGKSTVRRARDMFMPAFGQTTSASVPVQPSAKKVETKRNFSSAAHHEHDKVREQFKANGLIDYWKAHGNEHFNDILRDDENQMSQVLARSKLAANRSFSTSSTTTEPKRVIDYWNNHNDTHFTDYWEENKNAHV